MRRRSIVSGAGDPAPVIAAVAAVLLFLSSLAHAVPETTGVRVTDVTAASFSVVWMTDTENAEPGIEVYSDGAMQQRLTEGLTVTAQPAGSARIAQEARAKGIMKVRVAGVRPATTYYLRTVTKDPADPGSTAYSAQQQVTTASGVALYSAASGSIKALANDLAAFPVYVRPMDMTPEPGLGDLVILEDPAARYPVSAFVGDGALSPEGLLDLNNLFGTDGSSLSIEGGGTVILQTYRAGSVSILTQYRKVPQNSAKVSVVTPSSGFFADINIDGAVDDADFRLFKAQYRTAPDDGAYNPDHKFVPEPGGAVNVRDFSKFSTEYGRTDVH